MLDLRSRGVGPGKTGPVGRQKDRNRPVSNMRVGGGVGRVPQRVTRLVCRRPESGNTKRYRQRVGPHCKRDSDGEQCRGR